MNPSVGCGRDRSRADNLFLLRDPVKYRDAVKIRGRAEAENQNLHTIICSRTKRLKSPDSRIGHRPISCHTLWKVRYVRK
jgi:hypothetical protein